MEAGHKNNIKLGGFVISAIILLMGALYFIGKKQNAWTSGVEVRVQFSDLNGLMTGDNVLYAGMPAGNVEEIHILNDTTIQAKLLINKKTSPYIHRNVIVSIGSDGLMGDKVVNIRPERGPAALISDGDLLVTKESMRMDKMLPQMAKIGDNVMVVSKVLKDMVLQLDSSALMAMLKDKKTAALLRQSVANLDKTTGNASAITGNIREVTAGIKNGQGSIGRLLRDTQIVHNLIAVSSDAKAVTDTIRQLTNRLNYQFTYGSGPINMLLTDSAAADNLRGIFINTRLGTDKFNQNMEALQHNFLLRGFFNRKEKERQKSLKSKSE
jgi:phospholipid/cholesterol/gamma-HCH transport system substrate-binding protein